MLSIIKYVRRRDPVVLDDLVITSGVGNIYPKGIPVGKFQDCTTLPWDSVRRSSSSRSKLQ